MGSKNVSKKASAARRPTRGQMNWLLNQFPEQLVLYRGKVVPFPNLMAARWRADKKAKKATKAMKAMKKHGKIVSKKAIKQAKKAMKTVSRRLKKTPRLRG